ncbi:MAG: ABC transporter ATP-binding protein [Bdellovibrionota bacterium]
MNLCVANKLRLAHLNLEISAQLPQGKFIALLGPNGIGKTTLLQALIGEQKILGGSLILFDKPVSAYSPKDISTTVAYVPQDHDYPMHLRVIDLLRYAFLPTTGWFQALPPEEDPRIGEVLTAFALNSLRARPLGSLSTGERQRAFLARACLQSPRCLLLDEPTNHLDPGGVKRFWRLLQDAHAKAQFSVLMSTHELPMVQEYCDWVMAIGETGVLYSGKTSVFFERGLADSLY